MRKKITTILVILMFSGLQVILAQRTVTGTVTGASDNLPITGVTVLVKGTAVGTTTDVTGKYSIAVPDNQSALQFSFVGYAPQEVVVGTQASINITLVESMLAMDEVVVTALGIKRQAKALSYAASEIKGDDFRKAPEINLMNSLQGKIAGVDINIGGTGAAGSSRVTIRGNDHCSYSIEHADILERCNKMELGSGPGNRHGAWHKRKPRSQPCSLPSYLHESKSIPLHTRHASCQSYLE